MTGMRWRTAVVAAALIATVATWGTASAHAELERAEPPSGALLAEAPERVRLWFTEPVEPRFSGVQVLTAENTRTDGGSPAFDPEDPKAVTVTLDDAGSGTYTVSWQALSAVDGHLTKGVFRFTVGSPTSSAVTEVLASEVGADGYPFGGAAVRWLVFLAALTAVGGYLFRLLVMSPSPGTVAARRWAALVWVSLGMLTAGSVAGLFLQAAQTTGSAGDLPLTDIAIGTQWGRIWTVRMALIGALAAATAFLARGIGRLDPASPNFPLSLWERDGVRVRYALGLGLTIGLGMLFTLTLSSHAAAGGLRVMGIVADTVHLAAGAAWVGGLASLAFVGLPSVRDLEGAERRRALVEMAARFSTVALGSVALLVATGLINTWLRVGSWGALGGTPYGLTLVVKLTLLAVLVAAAAANLFYVRPRLGGATAGAPRLLARLLVVEGVAAVALLLVTGALTALPPARETWARRAEPVRLERTTEGVRVRLEVAPAGLGPNTYAVTLTDGRERAVRGAEVEMRLDYLDAEVASQEVRLAEVVEGRYEAAGDQLSVRGLWQAAVTVRRPGAFDAHAAFRFPVPASTPASAEARLPRLSPTFGRGTPIALELLALGVIGVAIGWRLRRKGARRAAVALGVCVLVFGGILTARAQLAPEQVAAASRVNPFPPDQASIDAGRALYEQQCLSCHGARGRGDGPEGVRLNPPPLDLTVHVPLHEDGQIFDFIAHGVPGTAMPAFEGKLSQEQHWHLVNYLREL